MRNRLAAVLLLLAACSPSTVVTTPTTVTTPATAAPALQTSSTHGPQVVEVGAGVIWEVSDLTDLGLVTAARVRDINDVVVAGDRLVAVGRDGGDAMVLLSDDQGRSWLPAQVEPAPGAESSVLEAVAVKDGALVAVGEGRSSCPDPNGLCDESHGAIWRSEDMGENWSVVAAPTVAAEPESFVDDVAANSEGFVAIGDVSGPVPASALVWTSEDGIAWSAGIPLPSSNGGFSRAGSLVVTAETTFVTGSEVLCGEWQDNGFWVITAGFVEQGRVWSFDGANALAVDLEAIGITQPPLPDCASDMDISEREKFESRLSDVGVVNGLSAIVVPGRGVIMEDPASGGLRLDELDVTENEAFHFVEGVDLLIGYRSGARGMIDTRSWSYSDSWTAQAVGLPVTGTGEGWLSAVVAIGDWLVGVGASSDGYEDGLVWRSGPGQLVEGVDFSCDPAPGADCRGVDLSELDLSGRNLAGIDFRNADLSGTDLSGSDLTGALLTAAELRGVDLSGAVLHGADLAGAQLMSIGDAQANLAGADFTGADLRGAHVDLSVAADFDEVLADASYFAVMGQVTGASFENASLVGSYFVTHYDSSEAALVASFDGADLFRSYYNLDTSGSSFAGTSTGDINFGENAVCPDGTQPWNESYGINRCNLDG